MEPMPFQLWPVPSHSVLQLGMSQTGLSNQKPPLPPSLPSSWPP